MTAVMNRFRIENSKVVTRARQRRWLEGVSVLVGVVAIWELLALSIFSGRHVLPTPFSVVVAAWKDHFYTTDLAATLHEAVFGWILGNGLALLLASACLLVPRLERAFLSLGVMTYAIPTVALGPILFIVQSSFAAKVTMSALSVFFITLMAAVSGLRSASKTQLDVVHVFGGGKWATLAKVRVRSSIPGLTSGLTISAPAAILGAIIGDYFGGQSGLGVVMLEAQQQLDVSRTWAIALVTTIVSALAYGLIATGARALGTTATSTDTQSSEIRATRTSAKDVVLAPLRTLAAMAFAIGIWAVLVQLSGLSSYFVKSPAAVWSYLVSSQTASTNRAAVVSALDTTIYHAGSGWLVGTVIAIGAAVLIVVSPLASKIVMPIVLVLKSVPLVAMTPLLALVFGRGLLGVMVIAGMVTVVPSVVIIADGLRASPKPALDLVSCAGGSSSLALRKVSALYAAPSIFTAAKVSMPGAVLGAVLAEWLVTGSGVGHAMAYDVVGSNFDNLWASIAAVVALSLILYAVVNTLERIFRSRLAIG